MRLLISSLFSKSNSSGLSKRSVVSPFNSFSSVESSFAGRSSSFFTAFIMGIAAGFATGLALAVTFGAAFGFYPDLFLVVRAFTVLSAAVGERRSCSRRSSSTSSRKSAYYEILSFFLVSQEENLVVSFLTPIYGNNGFLFVFGFEPKASISIKSSKGSFTFIIRKFDYK